MVIASGSREKISVQKPSCEVSTALLQQVADILHCTDFLRLYSTSFLGLTPGW